MTAFRPELAFQRGSNSATASLSSSPQVAIFTMDAQPFHLVAEGVPSFERLPPRR